ncbi:uncharacterized protein LOC114431689 [Parambassis ranga]|uniref:Uncharacterized protein LOC114431689 n=1 Tax=Parambassis ranga TaxID=210632 RepID=A0A6P7HMK0_9TELE|nr:uncharacterized protein LOC114431689 [Parambassis ranga]
MPRLRSGVWKHLTLVIKDGREMFMCNYCSQYRKNATKMQMHLDKCKEYSVVSQRSPGPDESSSASIPVPSFSFLPYAPPEGPSLIDSVDQRSQAYADECLARAVYATASPLTLTDDIYWKRFFSVLRPAYCPPTREALSCHLLDCEYDRVQSQVHEAIGKAESVTILCSGGSNLKETGTIIYVVATPLPLFYKCTKTKEQSTCIAEDLIGIINEVGSQKVFAIVTDDAPEMMAAWAQVEDIFPHISAIACTACGVQRLFDDVVAQPSMKSLCTRAEQVVRFFREDKTLIETFRCWQTTKLRNETSKGTLQLPSTSDWTGVLNMLSSLLKGQKSLQEMAVSPSLDIEASIRATLEDAEFWEGVEQQSKPAPLDWELY